jgi:hypothetical protein
MEYIIRDDYPAEKITNFIKTCKQIIEQEGACNCIKCIECPGCSEYNENKTCIKSFSNGKTSKDRNNSVYQNSLKFLEKYNKSSKRVFKVICI